MTETWIIEATDASFQSAVLERSKQLPVVVDFWAPWCGPCRTLGPLLERIATERNGEFLLAKVNVDENPALAQAFGVQSIPMVVALRGGQAVSEFVGALPEAGVKEFLARILPTEADHLAQEGMELLEQGKSDEAEALFRRALQASPRQGVALTGLAVILANRGEHDDALELLERVDPGPHRDEADRLAAQVRLHGVKGLDEAELRRNIDSNPDDVESRFKLGQVCAAAARHEEAFECFLGVVRRDRSFDDDAARKAMLDLFALLGDDHPLTQRYRSELAKVLFR